MIRGGDAAREPDIRTTPVYAVAVRFRLGDLLPGTTRTIGLRDHVVHQAPLREEDLHLLRQGRLKQLETFCGISFHGGQAERIPTRDILRHVGCDACQLLAVPVVLL
ncbi:hypothetical protein ORV05_11240 [Amycolatopsis cynarae]|uniref:Uncharacterized protein n=1 Tax=Amycolatopsis cynarae TaxID=2995223 RepID=A0ABY7B7J4_9PSEU|nr:hypothetical protein [Amycolatopsis sp. HUAS 11-8]WAL68306.1 hypothetical protein ORV05_11240 [Amycolatopsis sp. HUAS 11-8]